MELSSYGRIFKRWFLLIAAGTIIALAIGIGVDYKSRLLSSSATYQATSKVEINCTAPSCSYVSLNTSTVVNQLLPHANDPAATQATPAAHRANCGTISAFPDTNQSTSGLIDIQGNAGSKGEARVCANSVAQYLTSVYTGQITAYADLDIKPHRTLARHYRGLWLHYLGELSHTAPFRHAKRRKLSSLAQNAEQLYQNQLSEIADFRFSVLPAAMVIPAKTATAYYSKPLSPIKTIVPAVIVGFVLSFLLAAFLESRRWTIVTGDASTTQTANAFGHAAPVETPPQTGDGNNVVQTLIPSPVTSGSSSRATSQILENPTREQPAQLGEGGSDQMGEEADPSSQEASTPSPILETHPQSPSWPAPAGPVQPEAVQPAHSGSDHEAEAEAATSTQAATATGESRPEVITGLADTMRPTSELISHLVEPTRPAILVTSPLSSEPKSESAVGLAAALAMSSKRVVLVDADPNANVSRFFDMAAKPGLTDFLGYPQGPLQKLVQPANLPTANGSLWVLPYGVRQDAPMSYGFASGQMSDSQVWGRLLSQLASASVLIVIDGAAVSEYPQALDPANIVGGVVVALERERTTPEVLQTYEALRSRGANLLGVVANPTTIRLSEFGQSASTSEFSSGFGSSESGDEPVQAAVPDLDEEGMGQDPFQRR